MYSSLCRSREVVVLITLGPDTIQQATEPMLEKMLAACGPADAAISAEAVEPELGKGKGSPGKERAENPREGD